MYADSLPYIHTYVGDGERLVHCAMIDMKALILYILLTT